MAERSEFELPFPVFKLSDDTIMLEFATVRRIALSRGDYNPGVERCPEIGRVVRARYLSNLRRDRTWTGLVSFQPSSSAGLSGNCHCQKSESERDPAIMLDVFQN
jgi:hypothetical protein